MGNPAWRREIAAGATTFLAMAYIVVVNPAILSKSGMPSEDVFFATCIASAIGTFLMAFLARYPFALAPGMGLNAFFAFTVCGAMGIPWQTGLAAVLLSGILFLLLSVFGLRTRVVEALPADLIRAIAAGIGLFIAFIGLENGEIIIDHPATLVTLGDLTSPTAAVTAVGLLLTIALVAARVPGAILIGIIATAALAFATGIAPPPQTLLKIPRLPTETFGKAFGALPDLFTPTLLPVLFTMLFLDLFDTMGTLFALGHATGQVDAKGRLPRADKAFASDAAATIVGSILGTSTVTTYIESAAGIAVGGRTFRTAVVVGILFIVALPLFPLVAATPAFATAPALIVVGALMFGEAARIDWNNRAVAPAALATILFMPATYNISNGIGAGFVLYVVAHLAGRRFASLNPVICAIASLFVIYFVFRPGG